MIALKLPDGSLNSPSKNEQFDGRRLKIIRCHIRTRKIGMPHYADLFAATDKFQAMIVSVAEVASEISGDEDYVQLEMLIPDYSVLFFMGYAVGSHTMCQELMPVLKTGEAQLLHLRTKIAELAWLQKAVDDYKKEINE